MARAATSVIAVGAVNERDIVPERIGNGVFKLSDSVGPEAGWVFGELE